MAFLFGWLVERFPDWTFAFIAAGREPRALIRAQGTWNYTPLITTRSSAILDLGRMVRVALVLMMVVVRSNKKKEKRMKGEKTGEALLRLKNKLAARHWCAIDSRRNMQQTAIIGLPGTLWSSKSAQCHRVACRVRVLALDSTPALPRHCCVAAASKQNTSNLYIIFLKLWWFYFLFVIFVETIH